MTPEEYLDALNRNLKGFSPQERAALLEEIGSHIESGEEDPGMGSNLEERRQRLAAEMGTPVEMGRGLRGVHRPRRLADLLLVILPLYGLFSLLLPLFVAIGKRQVQVADPWLAWILRIEIAVGIGLSLVGSRRHSALLMAFWIPDALARIITLMTREGRWDLFGSSFSLETIFLGVVLVGLLVWLADLLNKNRRDLLLIWFALMPLISTAFGVGALALQTIYGVVPHYGNSLVGQFVIRTALEVISLGVFFLVSNRNWRWLALAFAALLTTVGSASLYWPNPMLVSLWAAHTAVVLVGWWTDWHSRRSPILSA